MIIDIYCLTRDLVDTVLFSIWRRWWLGTFTLLLDGLVSFIIKGFLVVRSYSTDSFLCSRFGMIQYHHLHLRSWQVNPRSLRHVVFIFVCYGFIITICWLIIFSIFFKITCTWICACHGWCSSIIIVLFLTVLSSERTVMVPENHLYDFRFQQKCRALCMDRLRTL